MRIGELLRDRGWVEPDGLDRAIAEQPHSGKRLVSLLVARGLLDPDVAARSLGAQHNVSAALQRHLENRDRGLARFVPPELARSLCALPIGRGRAGELIVCVRDPRPAHKEALAQATRSAILIAIAPASALERLVEQTYGPIEDECDVDLTTGRIDIPPEYAIRPVRVVPGAPPAADGGIDFGAMTLVGLDDARVAKDPSQSGQFVLPRTITPLASITPPPVAPPPAVNQPTESAIPRPPAKPVSLDDTLVLLERAVTRDAATDVAMAFVRGRWTAAVLFTITDGAALGHRGYGATLSDDVVQGLTMPLTSTSIVRAAHDTRRIVTEPPPYGGAIQDRLFKLLGGPTRPIAAPIEIGPRIAFVLVVGDTRDSTDGDTALDLDDLTIALGSAYARLAQNPTR